LNKTYTKVKHILVGLSELTEFVLLVILLASLLVILLFNPMPELIYAQTPPEEATAMTLNLGFMIYFWLKDLLRKNQHLMRVADYLDKIERSTSLILLDYSLSIF